MLGLAQEKLRKVRVDSPRGQTLPQPPSGELVQSLSDLARDVDGIEIDVSGILVLVTTPRIWQDFWNLTVETDPNHLGELAEKAQQTAAKI